MWYFQFLFQDSPVEWRENALFSIISSLNLCFSAILYPFFHYSIQRKYAYIGLCFFIFPDTKCLARLWNGFKMIHRCSSYLYCLVCISYLLNALFFEHFRSVLELDLQLKDMVKKVEIELQDNEFLIEPGLMRMEWNMWRYTSNGRARIFQLSIKMGVGF